MGHKISAIDAALSSQSEVEQKKSDIRRKNLKERITNKPSKLKRFCEVAWNATFHVSMCLYGTLVLWDKSWFWELKYCWQRILNQPISMDIWLYYVLELAFYNAQTISHVFGVRRSDFWQMFLHHFITIFLINFSYISNFFRIGSLVMWIHDIADIFLENAKLCNYLGWKSLSHLLFYGLIISWLVTRLGYYPTWIIYSTVVEGPQVHEVFPCSDFMTMMLCVLLLLHFFWFYIIAKMAYKNVLSENRLKDDRSDDSDDEE